LLELEAYDLEGAHELHRLLLAPVLAALPGEVRRLVIVPDGPLHGLPFELLLARAPGGAASRLPLLARFQAAHYAVEDYVLSYALSSFLLARGETRSPTRAPRFLGLAHSPRGEVSVRTPEGSLRLQRLGNVARELQQASRAYSAAKLFTGRAATAQALLRHAPRSDVIHIAAHAVADARSPALSGCLLAGESSEAPAVFLTADAIRRMPLHADLVTLSACDTGHGHRLGHEGILGLARAFVEAGAGAVLASLWPVDDEATRDLMASFYRRLAAGSGRALALAEAKRNLRHRLDGHFYSPRSHPFYWSPFVLIDHRPI
jgi:CHAT domain-containing protein